MKVRRVVLAPEAGEDLLKVYEWVACNASGEVAMAYVERIEAFCQRLAVGSERGHTRSDIRPGLRIIGFERRLTLAFTVNDETVTILRVFSAGLDWEHSL